MSTMTPLVIRRMRDAVRIANKFVALCSFADSATDAEGRPSKEMAAAKRASMDLTRALAEFRRGNV